MRLNDGIPGLPKGPDLQFWHCGMVYTFTKSCYYTSLYKDCGVCSDAIEVVELSLHMYTFNSHDSDIVYMFRE
jgi:hypothetical protein